jgi:hypothetical protein
MQDFSSISVSSYEAGSLADRLTEHSRDGWQVVAIVPTGSTITAYLCREAGGAAPAEAESAEPVAAEPEAAAEPEVPETPAEPEIAFVPETPAEPETVEATPEPVLAAFTPEPAPEAEPAPEPEPTPEPAAEPATAATASAAGAAPAGWYADPSGRFELRYWDGGQWTEHVSRAGQQYTDPPVA